MRLLLTAALINLCVIKTTIQAPVDKNTISQIQLKAKSQFHHILISDVVLFHSTYVPVRSRIKANKDKVSYRFSSFNM